MIKSFLLLITTLWIFKTFSLPKIYYHIIAIIINLFFMVFTFAMGVFAEKSSR